LGGFFVIGFTQCFIEGRSRNLAVHGGTAVRPSSMKKAAQKKITVKRNLTTTPSVSSVYFINND
jgi:hypothetical protein